MVLAEGLFIGTLFTLFVVPSVYMLVARDYSKDRERDSAITSETLISG